MAGRTVLGHRHISRADIIRREPANRLVDTFNGAAAGSPVRCVSAACPRANTYRERLLLSIPGHGVTVDTVVAKLRAPQLLTADAVIVWNRATGMQECAM